jgi:hypothetical protein
MRLKFEFKNEILYKIQLGIGHTREKHTLEAMRHVIRNLALSSFIENFSSNISIKFLELLSTIYKNSEFQVK